MQRRRWSLPALLACGLGLVPGVASAHGGGRSTVVDPQPLALTAGYDFEFSDIDRPGLRSGLEHTGFLELRVPLPDPVPPRVGAAISVEGVKLDRGLEPGPDFDARGFGVSGEVFWRDPQQGFLRVLYRFDRLDRDVGAVANDRDRHTGVLAVGVYHGRFDVAGLGRYRRIENDVAVLGKKVDGEYSAGAEIGVYPHDSTRLSLGGEWTHVPSSPFDPREAEALVRAEFQPPFGTEHFARLGVDASFGRAWTDEPGVRPSNFYTLGLFVRFDWPGSASLRERLREQSF